MEEYYHQGPMDLLPLFRYNYDSGEVALILGEDPTLITESKHEEKTVAVPPTTIGFYDPATGYDPSMIYSHRDITARMTLDEKRRSENEAFERSIQRLREGNDKNMGAIAEDKQIVAIHDGDGSFEYYIASYDQKTELFKLDTFTKPEATLAKAWKHISALPGFAKVENHGKLMPGILLIDRGVEFYYYVLVPDTQKTIPYFVAHTDKGAVVAFKTLYAARTVRDGLEAMKGK